ncbi:MAG: hypothetical protein ACE5I7_11725 [Candidatus Binatia bacterium]
MLLGIGLAFCCASAGWAQTLEQARLGRYDMFARSSNESGFTLRILLQRNIWALAKHPLSPEVLNGVGADVRRPPRRGPEFEFLTPGDVGATFHFRW